MATLETQTFDGLPSGMNLALPAHQLADTEAQYLQDTILDLPGLVRRRGPVRPISGFPTFTKKASGITGTISPAGTYRVGILSGDGSTGRFEMIDDTFSAVGATYTWNGLLPQSPYYIVDSKPALNGGVCIGTSSQYNAASPTQSLAFWGGGNKADYATGTVSLTRGSTTVTGSGSSWTANAASGMYLFATITDASGTGNFTLTLVGQVKSVDSNTSITLVNPSPYTTSGTAYNLTSVRGFQYKIAKGRLTGNTASTTITGANTKFISQKMNETVYTSNGTTSSGSPTLTGITSTSTLKAGMRVSGTNVPTGTVINSVDSGTQVTMSKNATGSATNTMTFRHGWNIYRSSDNAWVGRVDLVNNEISITLESNSTVALTNEAFYALCGTGDWGLSTTASDIRPGFLNAFYAGRQWYANNGKKLTRTSQVLFSETFDKEAVDFSEFDGDFFNVSSAIGTDTPIKALIPAYNALVIIKENETYAITGTSTSTFNIKKIQDDGTLCGMSAQGYGGGVIWAGLDGVYFYDGITVNNLTDGKLGQFYKNAVRSVDPNTYRIYSMVVRNHYFAFFEFVQPNYAVIKGGLSSTPSSFCIAINLETQAVSMMTNLAIRGFVETPADTGKQVLYVVNDNTKANICQGFDLFDVDANDSILCDGGLSAGRHRYGTTTLTTETATALVADTKYASSFTISARCAVQSLSFYMSGQGGGSANANYRAGIYADSSGAPGALQGSTGVTVVAQDAQAGFQQFNFATPLELAAGTYWFAIQAETSSRGNVFAGATAAAVSYNTDAYSDGLADPFGGSPSTTTGPLLAYATVLTVGPDFFIESKKMTEGDSMHKKLFKQLSLNYMAQGDTLSLATVPGLANIGKKSTSTFPTTVYTWDQIAVLVGSWDNMASLYPTWDSVALANFKAKRLKFLKRSQMMSFRLWQTSPAVSRATLGPFQIAFKWQRPGRI